MAKLAILAICGALAAAVAVAGCGGGSESATATVGATQAAATVGQAPATASVRRGKKLKAIDSSYGRAIADGRGEALYLFGKDTSGKSRCYGACARAWPPVIAKGRPRAGGGVQARLLGTTRRANGKLQVTYKGHPLYYYVDDSPGTILCQDVNEFGGIWLLVKPSGNPIG